MVLASLLTSRWVHRHVSIISSLSHPTLSRRGLIWSKLIWHTLTFRQSVHLSPNTSKPAPTLNFDLMCEIQIVCCYIVKRVWSRWCFSIGPTKSQLTGSWCSVAFKRLWIHQVGAVAFTDPCAGAMILNRRLLVVREKCMILGSMKRTRKRIGSDPILEVKDCCWISVHTMIIHHIFKVYSLTELLGVSDISIPAMKYFTTDNELCKLYTSHSWL